MNIWGDPDHKPILKRRPLDYVEPDIDQREIPTPSLRQSPKGWLERGLLWARTAFRIQAFVRGSKRVGGGLLDMLYRWLCRMFGGGY